MVFIIVNVLIGIYLFILFIYCVRVFFSQGLKNSSYLKYKYFVTLYIYFVTFDQFITFCSNISEYYCFVFAVFLSNKSSFGIH